MKIAIKLNLGMEITISYIACAVREQGDNVMSYSVLEHYGLIARADVTKPPPFISGIAYQRSQLASLYFRDSDSCSPSVCLLLVILHPQ